MEHTYQEIHQQPQSWKLTIDTMAQQSERLLSRLSLTNNTHILFIGCGTSYYLAQSGARLFQEITGHPCHACPASEVFLADDQVIAKGVPTVVIAISRSGTTTEVLYALEHLQKHFPAIQTVAITCRTDAQTVHLTTEAICLHHAQEQSVVMTQSFTNMLLAIQYLAASAAKRDDKLQELDRLPELLVSTMPATEAFGRQLGDTDAWRHYIYLGLGRYYGLAAEATLKLKEMTQTPCEYYNPLEFRHGPISVVDENALTVTLSGRREQSMVSQLLSDIQKLGGHTALAAPAQSDLPPLEGHLVLSDELSDWARPVLYMPAMQWIAYYRAKRLGLNPDQPRHLNQVVVI